MVDRDVFSLPAFLPESNQRALSGLKIFFDL
jgi:hypothetical protein